MNMNLDANFDNDPCIDCGRPTCVGCPFYDTMGEYDELEKAENAAEREKANG
jgi:hypothetical protein